MSWWPGLIYGDEHREEILFVFLLALSALFVRFFVEIVVRVHVMLPKLKSASWKHIAYLESLHTHGLSQCEDILLRAVG